MQGLKTDGLQTAGAVPYHRCEKSGALYVPNLFVFHFLLAITSLCYILPCYYQSLL